MVSNQVAIWALDDWKCSNMRYNVINILPLSFQPRLCRHVFTRIFIRGCEDVPKDLSGQSKCFVDPCTMGLMMDQPEYLLLIPLCLYAAIFPAVRYRQGKPIIKQNLFTTLSYLTSFKPLQPQWIDDFSWYNCGYSLRLDSIFHELAASPPAYYPQISFLPASGQGTKIH